MKQGIHQLVAGYSNGDAISNEARTLRVVFKSWGYKSQIYAERSRILPELRSDARELALAQEQISDDDIVLLHLSIGSPVNVLFPKLRGKKVILYHNITPPSFFRGVNEQTAQRLEEGLAQVKALAKVADINLADSSFNAAALEALGYDDVQVFPLALELQRLRAKANRSIANKYQDGKKNIIFVGRCAPNKGIEDLLYAFYYFQKYVEPESRLIHVGSFAGTEQYQAILQTLKKELRLENVDFLGSIPEDQLAAVYQTADLFLCMSEHEGFCIPLLEAMSVEIPVLAYATAAVPETMNGAGVTFQQKYFDEIAEMMGAITHDKTLRKSIIKKQNQRIQQYQSRDIGKELKTLLASLLN